MLGFVFISFLPLIMFLLGGIALFVFKDRLRIFCHQLLWIHSESERLGSTAKATAAGRVSAEHPAQPFTHALWVVWAQVLGSSCSAVGAMQTAGASTWPALTFPWQQSSKPQPAHCLSPRLPAAVTWLLARRGNCWARTNALSVVCKERGLTLPFWSLWLQILGRPTFAN